MSLKIRSIITISALISKGIADSSLKSHMIRAKHNGLSRDEMAEILTHIAFYAGGPNVWSAFPMAKEIYADEKAIESSEWKDPNVKQTAGRKILGDFAPKFAELNDDVLFGEVWARDKQLLLKTRSIVTITSLVSKGIIDSSLKSHITMARQNGVTHEEMAEILTHLAFYAGWPNAWGAFLMAKEVYANER